MKETRKRK